MPDPRATIARALALCERHLRENVEQPTARLRMTRLDEVVADVDDILGHVIDAFTQAASELNPPQQVRNRRTATRATTLSLAWADLMELDPDRMRRAYGTADLPTGWASDRGKLITAIERTLAQLESENPGVMSDC